MSNEINKNKSPSSAYGQWQNFSMGLQKLGGYDANIRNPDSKLVPVKQERDWFSDVASGLGALTEGASKLYEDYKERVNVDVEEYKESHSLEEIQKDMVNKNVPFQNDPIAMSLLKRKVGALYYNLADQEFSNKIQNGEFLNKSPEELDKAKFDFMRNKLKEIAVNNAFDFENEADKDFVEGFYANSTKSRVASFIENDKVTNKHLVDKSLMTDKANLGTRFSTGIHIVEDFNDAVSNLGKASGIHYSIPQLVDLVTAGLEGVASNPEGTELLKKLRHSNIAGLGVTGEELVGGAVAFDKFVADAEYREVSYRAQVKYALTDKVNALASDPTPKNLAELRLGLKGALESSEGVETWQTKLWHKGIEQAEKNIANSTGATKEATKMALGTDILASFYEAHMSGDHSMTDVDLNKALKENKVPDYMVKDVIETLVTNELDKGDPKRINRLLGLSTSDSFAGTYFKGALEKHFNRGVAKFNNLVTNYMETGVLPEVNEQGYFDYTPIGRVQGDTVRGLDEDSKKLLAIYGANPSAFSMIADGNTFGMLQFMDMSMRMGHNPIKAYAGYKKGLDIYDANQRQSLKNKVFTDAEIIGTRFFGDTQKVKGNELVYNIALSLATDYSLKNPDVLPTECFEHAIDSIEEQFMGISPNTAIPVAQVQHLLPNFNVGSQGIRDKLKDQFDKYLREDLGIPEDKLDHYLPYTVYVPRLNSIRVIDDTSSLIKDIPLKVLADRIANSNLKEAVGESKSRDIVREALKGGTVIE